MVIVHEIVKLYVDKEIKSLFKKEKLSCQNKSKKKSRVRNKLTSDIKGYMGYFEGENRFNSCYAIIFFELTRSIEQNRCKVLSLKYEWFSHEGARAE
jgi:hypothetical protein